MAYQGNSPAAAYTSFAQQTFSIVNSQTSYTLDHPVANGKEILLYINNVKQVEGSGKAYTASGNTLTIASALTNGTDEMYCLFIGKAIQNVVPPSGSVTSSMLASGDLTIPSGNLLFDTASKGIYLGVTSATASNLLDDYEEGLHTVTATDTGGGATITMNTSFDQLAYTKIGRVVHISGVLLFSSVSGTMSGTLRITLPFAASNLADLAGRTILNVGTYNLNFTSGTAPYFNVGEGNSDATIATSEDNANGGQGRVSTATQLYIQGTYFTDA